MPMKVNPGLLIDYKSLFHRCVSRNFWNEKFICKSIQIFLKQAKMFVEIVMDEFNKRFANQNLMEIERKDLEGFLNEFFMPSGSELVSCIPKDWTPFPPKLMQIADPLLREWALELNIIWKSLCKKVFFHSNPHFLINSY